MAKLCKLDVRTNVINAVLDNTVGKDNYQLLDNGSKIRLLSNRDTLISKINNYQPNILQIEDFSKQDKKGFQNLINKEQKEIVLKSLNTQSNNITIKEGVQELFESNLELANDVYEALGFTGKLKVSLGKELEYKDSYVSESRLKNFKKYEVLDENGKNIGTVVIEDRGNKTVILHPELSVIGKGYGKDLYKTISSKLGVTIQEWTEGAISKSDSAKAMWNSLEKEGSAIRIVNEEDGDNFRQLTYKSEITLQQKQQASFMFSEFLDVYLQDFEQVEKILKEENIIEKDCTGGGKLKAEKGLQTSFTKNGKWKIIKDLKGYPTHKEGGVDLTIGKNGVSIKNGNTEFTAKHGLLIPKN